MEAKLSLAHGIRARVEEWAVTGRPCQSGFDWKLDSWLGVFPEHAEFLEQLKLQHLGFIDRNLVKEIATSAVEDQVKVFLASMIWGYGTVGYGPHRVRSILDQRQSINSIKSAFEFLQSNDVANAYDTLITHGPDGLGPAFGTKYLYFASGKSCTLRPLILDKLIAEAITEWGNLPKAINSLKSDSRSYIEYLQLMSEAASDFEIAPEDLEELLFSNKARDVGSTTWISSSQTELWHSDQELYLGMLLASEMLLRDSDLRMAFTTPGGGQYDNITLYSKSGTRKKNIEINLNGTILYPTSPPVRFTWSELKTRGIQGALTLLSKRLNLSTKPLAIEMQSKVAREVRTYISALIQTIGDASGAHSRAELEKRIAEMNS